MTCLLLPLLPAAHAPGAKTVWWGTPDYASISSLEGHPQTPRCAWAVLRGWPATTSCAPAGGRLCRNCMLSLPPPCNPFAGHPAAGMMWSRCPTRCCCWRRTPCPGCARVHHMERGLHLSCDDSSGMPCFQPTCTLSCCVLPACALNVKRLLPTCLALRPHLSHRTTPPNLPLSTAASCASCGRMTAS